MLSIWSHQKFCHLELILRDSFIAQVAFMASLVKNQLNCTKNMQSGPSSTLSALMRYSSFNLFPNKPLFPHVCSKRLLKTLWEKEKLLVMRNF